jgi:hypothetical protein
MFWKFGSCPFDFRCGHPINSKSQGLLLPILCVKCRGACRGARTTLLVVMPELARRRKKEKYNVKYSSTPANRKELSWTDSTHSHFVNRIIVGPADDCVCCCSDCDVTTHSPFFKSLPPFLFTKIGRRVVDVSSNLLLLCLLLLLRNIITSINTSYNVQVFSITKH